MSDWTEVDGSRDTSWLSVNKKAMPLVRKVAALENHLEPEGGLAYMQRLARDIVGVLCYLEQGHVPSDLEPLRKAAKFLDPKIKLDVYADDFEIEI